MPATGLPAGPTTIVLPDRLDFAAARDLHADLLDLRTLPVLIDGRVVTYMGALAAQVLISASRAWHGEDRPFALSVSQDMHADLSRLGVLGEFPQLVEVPTC